MKISTKETGIGTWPEEALLEAKRAWEKLFTGSDMTGWLRLPKQYDRKEFGRILRAADTIRSTAEVLVVIGIGGSYLGARAAAEAVRHSGVELIYVGNDLSPNTLQKAVRHLEGRDFCINVISKSGTTVEPAIAFRIFRKLLSERYGKEADKRIYATTDPSGGALRQMAIKNGWESFEIPGHIGGRYSVLTAVGLLPMAAAGLDVCALLDGAAAAMEIYGAASPENPVWQYVLARNILYSQGKKIELFTSYEPTLHFFLEWLKQLFGESEGKQGKGLFPASAAFTTDLHSLGQYIQQGERHLIQTALYVEDTLCDLTIPGQEDNLDALNYLEGRPLSWVREQAFRGTMRAHISGGVPCTTIILDRLLEKELGELFYFFELACGMSGYMLGVNPFDQPGVEEYKRNMFSLLRAGKA